MTTQNGLVQRLWNYCNVLRNDGLLYDDLEQLTYLPPPDVIAREIVEDLEAALAEFAAIATSLAPEEPAEPSQ
jgi:hypothetical protein